MINSVTSIALRNNSALSCQRYPTHAHPTVPTSPNHMSMCGMVPTLLAAVATNIKNTETHFTYQERSPLGVTFLITLEEFNFLILSSSFSLIGSMLFGVLFIYPVDHVVGCDETGTLGHVFQSPCTYVCAGTPDSAQYVFQCWFNRSSVWQRYESTLVASVSVLAFSVYFSCTI